MTPARITSRSSSGRTVLVTGAAGFIGSHLSRALIQRGDYVLGLDDLSTGSGDNVADLAEESHFALMRGDISHENVVGGLVREADLVIHLAAVVGVQRVVDDALTTVETNVNGTASVLRACATHGVPVMLASTSEVYGKCLNLPAREDDDLLLGSSHHSRWSYAASKLVDEFLGLAYFDKLGLPVTIFRLFNTVGPRQTGRYGMVIPRLVSAALEGRPLPVHGDGTQSRAFLHVADAVAAILTLADCEEARGRVFNVGGEQEVSINQLAAIVLEHVGRPASPGIEHIPYQRAYAPGYEDIPRRIADTTRLRKLTGWRPRRSLDDIIRDVVRDQRRDHAVLALESFSTTGARRPDPVA